MRLGILGGTFNPIHLGHLVLAECAREQCALEQVWFIPTANPPHKSSRDLLAGEVRLGLVRLAIRGHPAFRASDLELKAGGVSYTIKTVRLLRERFPKATLFLIVGSDMLTVPWCELKELVRLCTFVVADRASTSLTTTPSKRSASRGRPGDGAPRPRPRLIPRVHWLSMPYLDISSSMIRSRIRRGLSIRYLVADPVARYIARHHLFRGGNR